MRSLDTRINRLERDRIHRCPVCEGKGRPVVTYDDAPVPAGKGCPNCGEVMHIRVRYVAESLHYSTEAKA